MKNALYIGIEPPAPKKPSLFIHDEVPTVDVPAIVFDPKKQSLDVFKDMTPRRAHDLAELLYTAVPEGQNTLTVRNGKRKLKPLLRDAKRFDGITTTDDEARAMLDDLLFIPELRNALTGTKRIFPLRKDAIIFARLNRKELGDFTCLVLGFVLMNMFKGQIIVPDSGFYLRDNHISLIRENRLILGCNSLAELPLRIRNEALRMKYKTARGVTYDDAVELAKYARLAPHTNKWDEEISKWMAP
jgi:hypothetical protein